METRTHVFHYTVDGEPQETAEHQLKPREILTNAGLNPNERYLVEIRGAHQISFKDKRDEPIQMHEHQQFISLSSGPTPVS